MSLFRFKLQTLLDFRRSHRDQCRQILAKARARDQELIEEKSRLEQQRHNQLAELRQLNDADSLNIDASASRRFYAGQLNGFMDAVEHHRRIIAEQLELCRKTLMEADQAVKALENLEEKQRVEFSQAEERRTQIALEDGWSATHCHEVPTC